MTLPLRERKKHRTARAIEAAAAQLFQTRGFDATTLEQIADAVEIHRQTILRYFKTKEDIAFAGRNRLFDDFLRGLSDRTGTVLEYWRDYLQEVAPPATKSGEVRRWFQFLDTEPRLYAYQLRLNERYRDALAEAFSEEAGVDPSSDVFAAALATLLVFGNSGVARMCIRSNRDGDVPAAGLSLVELAETLRRDSLPARWAGQPRQGRRGERNKASVTRSAKAGA